jgi:endonuclease YncB( thermonuclease family)
MRMLAILFVLFFDSTVSFAQTFEGQATVVDGDTIEIHGTRIRLWGIDTVESKQLCWDSSFNVTQCGRIAANAVAELIGRRLVRCQPISTDRYGRPVAKCFVNGHDLSEVIVRYGYAVDYARYSSGTYSQSQDLARDSGRGLWRFSWQYPENYRACMKTRGGTIRRCSQQQD